MDTYNSGSIYKMFLSSDLGVWLWEYQSDLLFFNKSYMDMLGYAHNKFPFHISTWASLIHPEDKDKVLLNQYSILNSPSLGDSFDGKFRMLTSSGDYLWILGHGFVLSRDEQGKALRICGIHINMNTLEKNLEAMDLQHDRMSFALEAANDGLWDWNPQTDEVYFSPRYISMLGYTPDQFPPKLDSWINKIHPDDLAQTVDIQREYVKSPAKGDLFDCVYRFKAATGDYRWILGRGKITKRDKSGHGTRVVGLHTDVTELRDTQEALVKLLHKDTLTHLYSRFYFDSILNKITEKDFPLSIIFCDLDGLKIVNDILGHMDGDKMLVKAAAILSQATPSTAIAARLGGDEFAVLLCNTTEVETETITAHIQKELETHNEMPETLPIFMSIGAVTSEHSTPIYKLLSYADEAMLKNKNIHRNAKRRMLISHIEKITGQKIDFLDNRLFETK